MLNLDTISRFIPPLFIPYLNNLRRWRRRRLKHDPNSIYYTKWFGQIRINGRSEFILRNIPADKFTFKQVFDYQEYNLSTLPRGKEILDWYSKLGENSLIVDCGANIGASPVIFSSLYPLAQIIAVEPDLANFNLLTSNTTHYSNIRPIHAAVAGEDGHARIFNPFNEANMVRSEFVDTKAQDTVVALSISSILRMTDAVPFILKIDIEGAESDLFRIDNHIIEKFPLILIELHDWLFPKKRKVHVFSNGILEKIGILLFRARLLFPFRTISHLSMRSQLLKLITNLLLVIF